MPSMVVGVRKSAGHWHVALQPRLGPRLGPLRRGRPPALSPAKPLEHLVDLEPRVQVLVGPRVRVRGEGLGLG